MLKNYFPQIGLCICLLLTACHSSPPPEAASPSPSGFSPPPVAVSSEIPKDGVHPVFQPILGKLQHIKPRVSILLPGYIPEPDGGKPVYAVVEKATPSEYSVLLGLTKDCNGGTACRLGAVFGEAITIQSPPNAGKSIRLTNGITGYFTEAKCGANCSDAMVSWDQNGGRYTVALKAGKLETLVKMANSAIENIPNSQ